MKTVAVFAVLVCHLAAEVKGECLILDRLIYTLPESIRTVSLLSCCGAAHG